MSNTVASTYTQSSEIILPADLNAMGHLFGGRLVSIIDKVAAISALKHCKGIVVTLSIDSLVFKNPVTNGSILTVRAAVNRVFEHSLEVGVIATTIPYTKEEEIHVCSAYLTFVALDEKGKKRKILPVLPQTPEEKRRYNHAGLRRQNRLDLKNSLNGKSNENSD